MKIIVLNDSHYSRGDGGQSTFIQNLHEELIKHAEIKYLHLSERLFKQCVFPIRFLYFIKVWFYFLTYRHKKWDYIISHTPEAAFVVSFFDIPFCHIFHGNNNPMTKSKYWYGKYLYSVFDFFEKRIIKKAKICYTVGEPRSDAKQIYVPILQTNNDIEPFKRSGIFFAGRLETGKNIDRSIEIYSNMSPDFRKLHKLHIIGSGTQEGNLRKLSSMKGLEESICFYGHLPNNRTLERIKSFKLLLMTSLFEGFPMIIGESLSLGIPVISTDVGSISNVIKNGYNGFCFPLLSENKIFEEAIFNILDDYEKYSGNALKSAIIFSPETLCRQILSDFSL